MIKFTKAKNISCYIIKYFLSLLLSELSQFAYNSHPYRSVLSKNDLAKSIRILKGVNFCVAHKVRNIAYTHPVNELI